MDRCRFAVEPNLHRQVRRGLLSPGFQIMRENTTVGPRRRDGLRLLGALRVAAEDIGVGESQPVRLHALKRTARWVDPLRVLAGQPVMWLPVLELETLTRVGVEICSDSDEDATSQLDALALALQRKRGTIEIKPRLGWCGYGDPRRRHS